MGFARLLLATLLVAFLAWIHAVAARNFHPVVLVPGYGSNQLEALLTAAYEPPEPSCAVADQQGWFQLWPNLPGMHDAKQAPCFADQMRLVYDAGADDYRNADGVATRVPFFGSTRGLVGRVLRPFHFTRRTAVSCRFHSSYTITALLLDPRSAFTNVED
jgi:hypothetical protein